MTIKQISLALLLISHVSHFINASQNPTSKSNYARIYAEQKNAAIQRKVAHGVCQALEKFPENEVHCNDSALPALDKNTYWGFKSDCLTRMLKNCEKQIETNMKNGDFRDCTDTESFRKTMERCPFKPSASGSTHIEPGEKQARDELMKFTKDMDVNRAKDDQRQ
jgi:hypothetical protein